MTRLRAFVLCLKIAPGLAAAETAVPPGCAIERLERARAACLTLAAERIELGTQHRLRLLAARAQSATAAEIRAYEQNLAETYSEYRTDTAFRCRADTASETALCRLSAARAWAERAAHQIAEAEQRLGLARMASGAVRLEIRPLPGGQFELDVLLDGVAPLAPPTY